MTEREFYEFFLGTNDDLLRLRKLLIQKLKSDIMDEASYDLLREVTYRMDERFRVYQQLKPFFSNRNIELVLKTEEEIMRKSNRIKYSDLY